MLTMTAVENPRVSPKVPRFPRAATPFPGSYDIDPHD